MNSWLNTAILSGCFLMLFALAEFLYHGLNVKGEYTRKLVHFGTGVLTMLFPIYLNIHWQVFLLCASFAIILKLSLKFNFLKSINDIERVSYGSLLYPLIVYLVFLIYDSNQTLIYFYLPILTMAICDPIAAIVGGRFPLKKYKVGLGEKSVGGSLAFLISSVLLSLSLNFGMFVTGFKEAMLTGVVCGTLAMLAEAKSGKGWDNFTIPLAVVIGLNLVSWL